MVATGGWQKEQVKTWVLPKKQTVSEECSTVAKRRLEKDFQPLMVERRETYTQYITDVDLTLTFSIYLSTVAYTPDLITFPLAALKLRPYGTIQINLLLLLLLLSPSTCICSFICRVGFTNLPETSERVGFNDPPDTYR